MCDKENNAFLTSAECLPPNSNSGNLVLKGKRHKNVYKVDIISLQEENLTCLSVINDISLLWHKRIGHDSFSHLNKLVMKDLVHWMPKIKISEAIVCDAYAKGKYVKPSLEPKKIVDTEDANEENTTD